MYPGTRSAGVIGTPARRPERTGQWRDATRIPRGMQQFDRWYIPPAGRRRIYPSDSDAVLHSRNGNRFLFFEFKPVGLEDVPGAQGELLRGLSLKEGVQAIVVFDPCWDDASDEKYDPKATLRSILFRRGVRHDTVTTVERLNASVADWYDNRGSLAEA